MSYMYLISYRNGLDVLYGIILNIFYEILEYGQTVYMIPGTTMGMV